MLIYRPRTPATALVVALGMAVPPVAPGELEEREAPLYAAAILYAAHEICTKKKPCCYSVGERQPSPELVEALQGKGHLKPAPPRGWCYEFTIDAWRTSRTAGEEQTVAVSFGDPDMPLLWCTYVLNLKDEGWVVDPSKTMCPIT